MKNNIVQFYRPITFIFCLGSLNCWIREICDQYSLLSLTWNGHKLVCCKIAPMWAEDYAQALISAVLRQVPMSLPDEEPLDIEYANDPCKLGVTFDATEGVTRDSTHFATYPRPHIYSDEEHMMMLELRAKELARDYPHMTAEQWKAFLLNGCNKERDSSH